MTELPLLMLATLACLIFGLALGRPLVTWDNMPARRGQLMAALSTASQRFAWRQSRHAIGVTTAVAASIAAASLMGSHSFGERGYLVVIGCLLGGVLGGVLCPALLSLSHRAVARAAALLDTAPSDASHIAQRGAVVATILTEVSSLLVVGGALTLMATTGQGVTPAAASMVGSLLAGAAAGAGMVALASDRWAGALAQVGETCSRTHHPAVGELGSAESNPALINYMQAIPLGKTLPSLHSGLAASLLLHAAATTAAGTMVAPGAVWLILFPLLRVFSLLAGCIVATATRILPSQTPSGLLGQAHLASSAISGLCVFGLARWVGGSQHWLTIALPAFCGVLGQLLLFPLRLGSSAPSAPGVEQAVAPLGRRLTANLFVLLSLGMGAWLGQTTGLSGGLGLGLALALAGLLAAETQLLSQKLYGPMLVTAQRLVAASAGASHRPNATANHLCNDAIDCANNGRYFRMLVVTAVSCALLILVAATAEESSLAPWKGLLAALGAGGTLFFLVWSVADHCRTAESGRMEALRILDTAAPGGLLPSQYQPSFKDFLRFTGDLVLSRGHLPLVLLGAAPAAASMLLVRLPLTSPEIRTALVVFAMGVVLAAALLAPVVEHAGALTGGPLDGGKPKLAGSNSVFSSNLNLLIYVGAVLLVLIFTII